jgi:hypothetical protein
LTRGDPQEERKLQRLFLDLARACPITAQEILRICLQGTSARSAQKWPDGPYLVSPAPGDPRAPLWHEFRGRQHSEGEAEINDLGHDPGHSDHTYITPCHLQYSKQSTLVVCVPVVLLSNVVFLYANFRAAHVRHDELNGWALFSPSRR